ncbi:hypothetical protein psal_cds_284 [Pandoravirus salinus]|uniref:Uncharacterized protein n=1 Tax=Pandoravirus salinus TaxID=1349410 RepID=S4VTQ9_9VIRU|nr:hypothetical protein psal_cds_284 [Pandoravirus salinus]AGO83874.1 hypothetical protein psal_cds_284 [Pandoravirus salinus]
MQDSNNDSSSAYDNAAAGEPRPTRRPLAVRKPKPTAGWADGAATKATAAAHPTPPSSVDPLVSPLVGPQQEQQPSRPQHDSARGQGKAGQSAAERSSDLRSAYRARMAAMRTSRVGGARRQARHAAEPEPQAAETPATPASDVHAPVGQANPAPPPLHLSRSQRKRLARSARSPAVLDAALARAGIADPASRAALADAIAAGVGDGDGALGERVTRALAS